MKLVAPHQFCSLATRFALTGLSLVLICLFRNQEAEFVSAEKLRRNHEQLREAQRLARVGSWELDLVSGDRIQVAVERRDGLVDGRPLRVLE